MVVRLRALAAEVTRVTLEVGSQGKLGGQAHVPDVEGVWFELVRNVSYTNPTMTMISSLTPVAGESNVFITHGSSTVYRKRHHRRSQRRLDAKNRDPSRRRNVDPQIDRQFHGGPIVCLC